MNDNEVKNAFDHIEPESGAQERMYANILKKAAAQKEDQNAEKNIEEKQPTVQKRRTIPMWRRWGSLAACLAIGYTNKELSYLQECFSKFNTAIP